MPSGSREEKAVEILPTKGNIPECHTVSTAATTSEPVTAKTTGSDQRQVSATHLTTTRTLQPRCARHLWIPTPSRTLPAHQVPGKLSGSYKPFQLSPTRLSGGYDVNEARIARERVLLNSRRPGSHRVSKPQHNCCKPCAK